MDTFTLISGSGSQDVQTPFPPEAAIYTLNATGGTANEDSIVSGKGGQNFGFVGPGPADFSMGQRTQGSIHEQADWAFWDFWTEGADVARALDITVLGTPSTHGFRVDPRTTSSTTQRVPYLALGGETLSAKAGYWDSDGTAQQTISGVGFEPGFLLVMTLRNQRGFDSDFSEFSPAHIGMTDGATQGSIMGYDSNQVFTSSNKSWISRHLIHRPSLYSVDLLNFTTDGFKILYTGSSGIRSGDRFIYLALADPQGNFRVGFTNEPNVNRPVAIDTGIYPEVMIFGMTNATAYDTVTSHYRYGFGFADRRGNNGMTTTACQDGKGLGAPATRSLQSDTRCIGIIDHASVRKGDASCTISGRVATMDWANTDGSERLVLWAALHTSPWDRRAVFDGKVVS